MKINIKTQFWHETSLTKWQERYNGMQTTLGFFIILSCLYFIYKQEYILATIYSLAILSTLLQKYSYWTYQKQQKNKTKNKTENTPPVKEGVEEMPYRWVRVWVSAHYRIVGRRRVHIRGHYKRIRVWV